MYAAWTPLPGASTSALCFSFASAIFSSGSIPEPNYAPAWDNAGFACSGQRAPWEGAAGHCRGMHARLRNSAHRDARIRTARRGWNVENCNLPEGSYGKARLFGRLQMAKFEEADPRWKVKDMGDGGKNVNGWHWSEKDTFPWFKDQFTTKFDDNFIFEGASNGPSGAKGYSDARARLACACAFHMGHPEYELGERQQHTAPGPS